MQKSKIVLLCNNKIGIPAMRELLFYDQVAAIVVPSFNKDLLRDIHEVQEGAARPAPVVTVTKKDLVPQVSELIHKYGVAAAIIMTFPYRLPSELFSLPPKGFINFHYGRLPQYQGPDPIFNQIARQEKNPALTVHVLTDEMDAGPVILEEPILYNEDDTYGQLQSRMAEAGVKLISTLMKIISFGTMVPSVPQDETKAAWHKKPAINDLMISWEKMDSAAIKALVNACNPWNKGAGASIGNRVIGITEVMITGDAAENEHPAGTIIHCNEQHGLVVNTCDGKLIKLTIVYLNEGFFSGYRLASFGIRPGMRFD